MLTLRFESNSPNGTKQCGQYQVYECERYNVSAERCAPETEAEKEAPEALPLRFVVRMFRSSSNENPYYESIGPREPHGTCYVMNAHGKTIDVIR